MRLYLGAAIWLIVLAGTVTTLIAFRDSPALEPARRLARYAARDAVTVTVTLPREVPVEDHTQVLVYDDTQFLRRIGVVRRVASDAGRTVLTVEVFPEEAAAFAGGARVTYYTVPGTAAWIVKTLIPPERIEAIREMWREFYAAERADMAATLWPAVRGAVQEVLKFYEREVPRVLLNHRAEIEALAQRHRDGAFERSFMPAVKDAVWERAQRDLAPLLEEIGRQLWERLPVWGLGWRYVYEKVPFTNDDHVRRRFSEFLENDALPLLETRSVDIVRIVTQIFRETLTDARVSTALKAVATEVAKDPETIALARKLTAELFFKNDRLRELIRRRWEEKGLKVAVASVGTRFEPFVRDSVNSIVLTADLEKMHPRLSRVLRSRVLRKDGAWLLLEKGEGPALTRGARFDGRIDGAE